MEREDQDLDPKAILAELGVTNVREVTPVTGGQDTRLWRVVHGEGISALRVFRAEQIGVCRREAEVMQALLGHVPVPVVENVGLWYDRPALLMSWIAGRTLGAELLEAPEKLEPLGLAWGRALAQVHAAPIPAVLLEHTSDWIADAGPEEMELQRRLLAVASPKSCLIHLDFHPMNLMTDGVQITAVLDWANAMVGDPRADFARTVVLLRLATLDMPMLDRETAAALVQQAEDVFGRGYFELAGEPEEIALFLAWAWSMTYHDYAAKRGRPGIDFQQERLDKIVRHRAFWKQQAGIVGS